MATVRGGGGSDRLRGTGAADWLFGLGGDDLLFGGGGDDRLLGGPGIDVLQGGEGADLLDGGTGPDLLDGGPGSDTLAFTDPTAFGGGVEVDLVEGFAKAGSGQIDVVADVENVTGTGSADTIFGDEAANLLRGLGGVDFLGGAAGGDRIEGGDGGDFLAGDTGNDRLLGGGGGDRLDGGLGADTLEGGAGADVFEYRAFVSGSRLIADGRDLVLDFQPGRDLVGIANDLFEGDALFEALDSDGSGRLDDRDRFVEIETLSQGGRSAASTVVDIGGLVADEARLDGYAPGSARITLFAAVGLGEGDIAGNP